MPKIELISPGQFKKGAYPRIMAVEAEHDTRLVNYSSRARGDDQLRRNEEFHALQRLFSPQRFRNAGLVAVQQKSGDNNGFWLVNGARVYLDEGMPEISDAERNGPKEATAGTLGGIIVMGKLAAESEIPLILFRRSGTYVHDADPLLRKYEQIGFHMNYLVPTEVFDKDTEKVKLQYDILDTHAATRMYTWEGMIGPEGFLLSQRALSEQDSFMRVKTNEPYGFSRLEDISGEQGSEWGLFMALATTSVLLRIFEHTEEKDLFDRLVALRLQNPEEAMRDVSRDLDFKKTHILANSQMPPLSALEIQTEYAKIAAEFASRMTLPADEQFAVDQWNLICRDLAKASESGDLLPLFNRMGNIRKYLWLQRKDIGPLIPENDEAVMLDMAWDIVYPKSGGRLQNPKEGAVTIVTQNEILDTVYKPPLNNRAGVRGRFIRDFDTVYYLDWDQITGRRSRDDFIVDEWLHPYESDVSFLSGVS